VFAQPLSVASSALAVIQQRRLALPHQLPIVHVHNRTED
jgi:hypothetical protein